MIIIKLGGSVITYKDKPFTPNLKNLYGTAKAIADYWNEEVSKRICIIHGGGSYAHVVASRYASNSRLTPENRKGLSLITWSARKLNDRVIESLVDYDLPVFPLQTSSIFVAHKRKPKVYRNVIEAIVENGWIPVLYGDIILGSARENALILSGEKIIEVLSGEFDVEKIIVCTDTTGVLIDKNKQDKGFFKSINSQNIKSVMRRLGSSSGIDVTGGMKQKVRILYDIAAKKGIRSIVINGTDPTILYNCLRDQTVIGTWIERVAS